MKELLSDSKFVYHFKWFLFFNVLVYLIIIFFHNLVPFNITNYKNNSHHFLDDPRENGGKFLFLRSLGNFDAQWYLKIAQEGYPKDPVNINQKQKDVMEGLSYAFFPLYPLVLRDLNFIIKNVELTGFFVANFFLVANFISLYFILSKLYNPELAAKTAFLFFAYPFSIFYRSYYTEGLFVFLLIWFSYFVVMKDYIFASLVLGLLSITRGNALLLIPFTFFLMLKSLLQKDLNIKTLIVSSFFILLPFFAWLIFNFVHTGDPIYFAHIQSQWYEAANLLDPLMTNIKSIASFPKLSLHLFHESKIDVLSILGGIIILVFSRKILLPKLWWISFLLMILPLLTKDTISYSRYIAVIFPFFIFIAAKLKNNYAYFAVLFMFYSVLLMVSLLFVNWYWIG